MASQNEGYWSRSWSLLTRDEGWFKPLLVLAAAQMVPIAGPFGTDGYALEWGRLTAWGVDAAPKQRNVDVGACIKTGARAFVVGLGFALAIALIEFVVNNIFGDFLGGVLSLAISILAIVVVRVASLRSAIYQRIGAGYQVNRIYDMIKRDHKGFLRLTGLIAVMYLVLGIGVSILTGIVFAIRLGSMIPELIRLSNISGVDDMVVVELILRSVAGALPMMFVVGYVVCVIAMFAKLMETTATALWMRQFDVANWGESADPLPDTPLASDTGAPTAEPQSTTPVAPTPAEEQQASYPIPQAYEPNADATAASQVSQDVTPVETPAGVESPQPASTHVSSSAEGIPFAFPLEADKQDAIKAETSPTAPAAPAEPARNVTDEERIETIRRAVDATFDEPDAAGEQELPESEPAAEPEPEPTSEPQPEDDDVRQALDSLDVLPDEEPEIEVDEEPAPVFTDEEPAVDVEEALTAEAEDVPVVEEELPTPTAVWPTPVEQQVGASALPVEPIVEPVVQQPAESEAPAAPAGPSGTTVMTFSLASAAASQASPVATAPEQEQAADEDDFDAFDGESEEEEVIRRVSSHEAVIDALDLSGGLTDSQDEDGQGA